MTADPTLLPDLPDEARVWVYVADRPLGHDDESRVLASLEPFLASWTSHRRSVRGSACVLDGRFLVLGAYAPDGDLSGCGIDKSVHRIEDIGRQMNLGWHGALQVAWRDDSGQVCVDNRPAFRRAARANRVSGATPVFDLSVETLADMRQGRFEKPAALSWHAAAFGLSDQTA